jgi:LPXTG-motif cell wall-anchored protein
MDRNMQMLLVGGLIVVLVIGFIMVRRRGSGA